VKELAKGFNHLARKGGDDMHKKVVCLCASLVFVLGLAAAASAAPWAQVWYGGMVSKYATGMVDVDTGIWVFNPNTKKNLKARIIVYDKYGTQVATEVLYDGGAPSLIAPFGYGWITLGMLVGPTECQKFTFCINFTKGNTLPIAPVVEIKEIIYTEPRLPAEIHNNINYQYIKTWSETSLGGPNGTGFFWTGGGG
jgi:hypothetical protein